MPISVKRVYDPPSPADGLRVLVDRLWPRGLSKVAARIDLWAKELSPSHELRQWYAHDAKKWPEFKRRFFAELKTKVDALEVLSLQARKRRVTLLFGSKEPRFNNAFALKQCLESGTRRSKLPKKPLQRARRKRRPAKGRLLRPAEHDMSERFISEAIQPVTATYDTARMATGEPGLPREFVWRGRTIEVAAVLRSWRETGKCRHGSPELYVRKHWYEVATGPHETMKIYFERQPRGTRRSERWWLFSIRDLEAR